MSDIRSPVFFNCRFRRKLWKGVCGALSVIFLMAGCGDMQAPTVKEALQQPFGTGGPFDRGTTKAEVLEAWGKPDHAMALGVDELGNPREEWIYRGRLPNLPIDYEYVSRTKHLFFEGENLVRWTTEEKNGTGEH